MPSSLTEFRQSKRETGSRKHTVLCLPPSHLPAPFFCPSTDGAKLGKLNPSYRNLGGTFPRVQPALPLDNKRSRCCQQGRIFLNFLCIFPFSPFTCNIILVPRGIYINLQVPGSLYSTSLILCICVSISLFLCVFLSLQCSCLYFEYYNYQYSSVFSLRKHKNILCYSAEVMMSDILMNPEITTNGHITQHTFISYCDIFQMSEVQTHLSHNVRLLCRLGKVH